MTRQLALDINILWEKKGGGQPAFVKPEGWTKIMDANKSVPLAVRPGFVSVEAALRRAKAVFEGYDAYAGPRPPSSSCRR